MESAANSVKGFAAGGQSARRKSCTFFKLRRCWMPAANQRALLVDARKEEELGGRGELEKRVFPTPEMLLDIGGGLC